MGPEALIDRLTEVLRADDRVRAAWLSGSRGRGTADAHSDVDLWVVVESTDRDAFVADWPELVATVTPVVLNERVGSLPVYTAVTPDWVRFDVAVGTVEEVADRTRSTLQPLFDKDDLGSRLRPAAEPLSPSPATVGRLTTEFLRVLGLLPTVIGRQEYVVAVSGVGLLHTLLVRLMTEDVAVEDRGGVLHLRRLLPSDRYDALVALPPLTATRESTIAAHLACAELFLPLAFRLCERTGTPWPEALFDACRGHLDRELGLSLPDPRH